MLVQTDMKLTMVQLVVCGGRHVALENLAGIYLHSCRS
jgi:hypothetical protein